MKVAVGCDHAGTDAREKVMEVLKEEGHEVLDMGTDSAESVDYPDFAGKVAKAVSSGEAERGVLICGTGIGMAMAANKIKGVRAAVCHDEYTVKMTRAHNDANVLCMGSRVLTRDQIADLTLLFINNVFDGGRHEGRIKKMMALEGN